MLLVAGVVSFYLRYNLETVVGPVHYDLSLAEFMNVLYQILPLQLLIFAILGLYNLRGTRRFAGEFGRIVIGISLGLFLIIILFFFNQTIFPSRFIILAAWGIGILLVLIGRLILRSIQRYLLSRGRGLHKLVIVNGNHTQSEHIARELKQYWHGYLIVAELAYQDTTIDELQKLYDDGKIDEIMQTNPSLTDTDNLKLVEFARNKGLQFSFVPNLFEVQRSSIDIGEIQGIPVISLKNSPLDGWGRVAKRLFDIITSSICLLITSPFFLTIFIAIKLDSKGPVIYSALRGGRGKDFRFYKFRSMYTHLSVGDGYGGDEAEKIRLELWKKNDRGGEEAPFLKIKDDPRVTRIGKFLRKSKLDELPQFWNIFKGNMSMVGPRPHVLDEVDRYRSRYRRMFSIKPGSFGMSQIAQISWPDLPFDEEIRLNTYYIENWSLWLDVKILAKSFWLLFFAKKPKGDY